MELRKLSSLFFLLILASCQKNEPDWILTFSDEFNENSVNTDFWSTKFSWGQHLSGQERCLFIDEAFKFDNGIMKIICEEKDTIGDVFLPDWSSTKKQFSYTTGHLYSKYKFSQRYGRFEIRAKTAFGKGFNSAFWMMTDSGWPPEIDIFEVLGKDPNLLRTTNHFLNSEGKRTQASRKTITADLSSSFNTYAIEWSPSEIVWYLNDQIVFKSSEGIPQEPMYLIISHAMDSDFSGFVDESTPLPAYFEIDYVRVYKRSD